jgi:RecA-family ATPase
MKDIKTEKKTYQLVSLFDLAERTVNKSEYLLGDGWLERGDGGIIFSGAGIGKSVISNQMAFNWGAGREAFGIYPNGPLKVIIVQAEDGENDQIRMAKMANHLGFTAIQKAIAKKNCHMLTCNDVVNDDFFRVLESLAKSFQPDLVIINPLHSYMGGDVTDEASVKDFLRARLTPMLKNTSLER